MTFFAAKSPVRRGRFLSGTGFTLIELLVVMAIIGSLAMLMRFNTPKNGPSEAAGQLQAYVSHARTLARATNSVVRIVLPCDPAAGENNLRSMLLVSYADTAPKGWVITTPVQSLAPGSLLSTTYSTTTSKMKLNLTSGMTPQDGTSGVDCIYIEVNNVGEITAQSGQQFVMVEGRLDPTTYAAIVQNSDNRAGFIVRNAGGQVAFRSPSEIIAP